MPTILNVDGYSIRIYFNDHLPSHVHVIKNNGECVINFIGKNGKPELREVENLKTKEVRIAIKIVEEHQDKLIAEWKKIHGG
ncbi:MAG: DUF4160 domain-containing protein [Cyanobacteria bacterium P01_G01_bin.19]